MLAIATPVFDGHGIREGPGYRPVGKSGSIEKNIVASPVTAPNVVTKGRARAQMNRSSKFIQDNQFLNEFKFDPTKGTPLSKPNADGNQAETALIMKPVYAEPINGALVDVLSRVNNREQIEDFVGRLTAMDIEKAMKGKIKMDTDNKKVENIVKDYIDAQLQEKKEKVLKGLQDKGFSKDEATKAYEENRKEEAKRAITGAAYSSSLSTLQNMRLSFSPLSPSLPVLPSRRTPHRPALAARQESSSSSSGESADDEASVPPAERLQPRRTAKAVAAAISGPAFPRVEGRLDRLRALAGNIVSDTEHTGGTAPRIPRGGSGRMRMNNQELYEGDTDAASNTLRGLMERYGGGGVPAAGIVPASVVHHGTVSVRRRGGGAGAGRK